MGILKYYLYFSELKMSLNLAHVKYQINDIINEPSLYHSMNRKSKFKRTIENWGWFLKYKEANMYYNSYGFDVEGYRNQSEFLPYRKFRIERNLDLFNRTFPVMFDNKITILRDKILFSSYFGLALGKQYVIPSIGKIFPDGGVVDYSTQTIISVNDVVNSYSENLFVKKINGECGDGCYLINCETDLSDFAEKTKGSTYLIQKQLRQHEDINKINDTCINSIRIITIIGSKSREPQIFAHYMRFGGGKSVNDNRATGGLGVAINDDGYLAEYGVGHHAVSSFHPYSKVAFKGNRIPFWNEVKNLVIKAHRLLPEIKTIGWDVAITPNGPVLIEGNDNWEISGAQDTFGGLKGKWYELRSN